MIPPGSRVLCAVSGGADSVCLLHWLSRRKDISLMAAHFNHQLRGKESDRDQQFVRELCEKWHIPLTVGQGDVASHANKQGLSIEEAARNLRYAFLREAAEKNGCDLIATAHNADDNLETLLLNLTRGAGLQGLTGIPPKQGILVRPLLSTTRKEIEEYLRLHDLPHVEDSSNADETYSRNKMRRQVLPLLEELNPSLREKSIDTIRYLRADNDYLNALAADLSQKAVVESGTVSLPAMFIAGVPDPVAIRVARQLLGMTAQGSPDCTAAHLEGLVALCRGGDPSGEVHLPHGLTARRVYEKLVITDCPITPSSLESISLHQGENPIPGTDWAVVVNGPAWPGLVVRSRRTGDELTLPGKRRRSLKKLFIDAHIPRLERERVPIVADDAGVLAVAGFGPNTGHPRFNEVHIIQKKEERDNG